MKPRCFKLYFIKTIVSHININTNFKNKYTKACFTLKFSYKTDLNDDLAHFYSILNTDYDANESIKKF